MSTEYKINIHRKNDNKLIGSTMANQLKTIFDSEFCTILGCRSHYNANNIRFEYSNLTDIIGKVEDQIKLIQLKNSERKFQIALTTSVEIKEQLEHDIDEYQTYIDEELRYVIYAALLLQGMISCIVEDQINLSTDKCAYEYNAEDLPKSENSCQTTIWENDVYCEVVAC